MTIVPVVSTLAAASRDLKLRVEAFLERAGTTIGNTDDWDSERDFYWTRLDEGLRAEASALVPEVLALAGQVAVAVRGASLASEADQREVMVAAKTIRSSLLLRQFRHWDTDVLHDEGAVLGVRREGQSDDEPNSPRNSLRAALEAFSVIDNVLAVIEASQGGGVQSAQAVVGATKYRPGTAFIIMSMDPSKPELDDVVDTVKRTFSKFDVKAIRADEIEHDGVVTERILEEIATAEFIFADLTGERPNVYYEVGYAHALKRRVMLYRREGTGLHFDVAGYNCPAYRNLGDLEERLTRRLEAVTNRTDRQVGAAAAQPPAAR